MRRCSRPLHRGEPGFGMLSSETTSIGAGGDEQTAEGHSEASSLHAEAHPCGNASEFLHTSGCPS